MLIAARVLQGVGAALLTPGSLAMIQGSFHPADRARAIGAWSGLGGIAAAIGPFVGGWLVQFASWRWVFLLNLPLAVLTLLVAQRHVPRPATRTRCPASTWSGHARRVRAGVLTFALIESQALSTPALAARSWACSAFGFIQVERTSPHPMMPLALPVRQFSAANAMTC